MKRILVFTAISLLFLSCEGDKGLSRKYEELPLGAIKPEGWLKEMLLRQRDGITAHLDSTYSAVMGDDNGWLGGEGDRWERGPYWIDGLLPLAYILDDEELKAKAGRWVEWALASQREDGFFGPEKGYPYSPGLQRGMPLDWWPRIVMLKVLRQYYNATADPRVMDFFDGYFRYQLATLPTEPLDKWSFWARYRAGDNLDVVLWYYSKTGKPWLLELANLIHSQSFDFTGEFLRGELLSTPGSIHCVNLAQGLKEPVVYWQMAKEDKYLEAVKKGLADLRKFNGFANGMYGGDEALHGSSPAQGSELCSAVELMFSYEQMLKITGDTGFADNLERVAFNTLPAQVSDDFTLHQYFQKPNQAQVTLGVHNFDVGQKGTGHVFGFLTAYPCCLSNQHQGWPKFTQNLWYGTKEGGLAAMVYSPCRVSASIGGEEVNISEETHYPMDGRILFRISVSRPVSFPIELRIPVWCKSPSLTVCGEAVPCEGPVAVVRRNWKDGDVVVLELPMDVEITRWHENSAAVERGPLVYALGLEEEWKYRPFEGAEKDEFGDGCMEVLTSSKWNYALDAASLKEPSEIEFAADTSKLAGPWYWSLEGAPVSLKVKAVEIPSWTLYNGDCGPIPWSVGTGADVNVFSSTNKKETRDLTLVPYGCTTLRISQFPVVSP